MIVVIPTAREVRLDFLRPLLDRGNRFLVVDDTEDERIRVDHPDFRVLHRGDRERILGPLSHCIPSRNGACRDFGLLVAYRESGEGEVIACLDDDCQVEEDFGEGAAAALGRRTVPVVRTAHRFYNPLDLYGLGEPLYPRGFPYEERARDPDYDYSGEVTGCVVFHLGLWRGVFDINAIDKSVVPAFRFDEVSLRVPQVCVPAGPLVSLCSMNMILSRETIPAIYQLPMNEPAAAGWTIDRYGDIWGGYIAKSLIDRRGDLLTVGEPLITHHKDGDARRNVIQEHYAHVVNLPFCDLLERAVEGIPPDDYLTMYEHYVDSMESLRPSYPDGLTGYLVPTVRKMRAWVRALRGS